MKKFTLALLATAAMVLGFGGIANAYPPGSGSSTLSPEAPAAGADFTVTTTCQGTETVTFTFNGTTKTADCASGVATVTFTAPTAAGTYPGTTSGSVTGPLTPFSVTIPAGTPAGGLPDTGSNGTATMTMIAIGLFAVGAGLFGVSQMRRRTAAA